MEHLEGYILRSVEAQFESRQLIILASLVKTRHGSAVHPNDSPAMGFDFGCSFQFENASSKNTTEKSWDDDQIEVIYQENDRCAIVHLI